MRPPRSQRQLQCTRRRAPVYSLHPIAIVCVVAVCAAGVTSGAQVAARVGVYGGDDGRQAHLNMRSYRGREVGGGGGEGGAMVAVADVE